jgi:hypothetical protein
MREIISNLRTEIVESQDGTKRYSLKKVWDESKPSMAVVMMCPSSSGEVAVDTSTALTMANCYRLGYGSVTIVNLFPVINDFSLKASSGSDAENLEVIVKAVEVSTCAVFAPGTGKAKNRLFMEVQKETLLALRPYEAKLRCLCDEKGGSKYLHPLSPRVREWHLAPLSISELIDITMEEEKPKKGKGKVSSK